MEHPKSQSSSAIGVQSIVEIEAAGVSPKTPLVVDLDDTLVSTDTLWECLLDVLRRKPRQLIGAGRTLLRSGKSAFKQSVVEASAIDVTTLPYNEHVLGIINEARAAGRPVILATATNVRIAQAVADHLGVFDDVLASDEEHNLKGDAKLQAIRELLGDAPFDYMGDNVAADTVIWEASAQPYRVGKPGVRGPSNEHVVDSPRSRRAMVKALRPHQWSKNALVFVPLFMAHNWADVSSLLKCLVAMIAMSLCASAIYIFNDLLDLGADRAHHSKKNRPFAAGRISIPTGLMMGCALMVTGLAMGLALSLAVAGVLVGYLILTTAYSLDLKSRLLLDVVVLAILYTTRLVLGGVASDVVLSQWLLSFSIFLFFSLAFAKRYTELHTLVSSGRGDDQVMNRGYNGRDLDTVGVMGIASGLIAVLVFCLYVAEAEAASQYQMLPLLWGICPILLYWITRMWFLTKRGEMRDDPIVFALRDRTSLIVAILTGLIIVLSTFTFFGETG